MFETITWLITKQCALNCHYCDFRARPVVEAEYSEKIKTLKIFSQWPGSKDRFICILGGDIINITGVYPFVDMMNELGLPYGLQTSATSPEKLKTLAPVLKNLSISIDPCAPDFSRYIKGVLGAYWAGYMRAINPTIDIHSSVTVDRHNMKYVPYLVQWLSKLGIWTEVTIGHWKKNPHFDLVLDTALFSPQDGEDLLKMSNELIILKRKGVKIHSSEAFLREIPVHAPKLDWICDQPYNLVLDVDLTARLCLHLPGDKVRKWDIHSLAKVESWEEFLRDWKEDQKRYCNGCLWDCQYEIAQTDKVAEWFNHKG